MLPPSPRGVASESSREAHSLRCADDLIASGRLEEALVHLRQLVRDLPNSTRGYLRMASLLRETKRAGEARQVLETAVSRSPHCPVSREALAEVCLEVGLLDEAIRQGRALMELRPQSLAARDVLIAAYLKRGQFDKALRVTDEMIRLDPNDPSHHFRRAVLLQQQGHFAAAVYAFQRVLYLSSDPELEAESRAALELLDNYQLRQILTLATENVPFGVSLRQDPLAAIAEQGFVLSDDGLQALIRYDFDLRSAPAGWRHYRCH